VSRRQRKLLYIALGLGYLLWPYDLIPDFIRPLGYLDDLIVIGYLYWRYHRLMPVAHRSSGFRDSTGPASSSNNREESTRSEQGGPQEKEQLFNPYTVLGISENHTTEELEKGYKALVAKYHPDKVTHLGEEFQQLAHQRMIEIQRAYQTLKKSRSG